MSSFCLTRLIICLVFFCAAIGAGCGSAGQPVIEQSAGEFGRALPDEPMAEGNSQALSDVELATDFSLPSLTGETVSLASLHGKFVLVNFWATWCIPCRKEMPYLQELSEKHGEQLVVLGVNMREDIDRVQPFVDKMALTFPILLKPTDELLIEHNVRGLPVSFVVDPDGAVIYRRAGEILPNEFDPWLAENMIAVSRP